jgi:hypothetical protein
MSEFRDVPVVRAGLDEALPIGTAQVFVDGEVVRLSIEIYNDGFRWFVEAGDLKQLSISGYAAGVDTDAIKMIQDPPPEDRNGRYLALCTQCLDEGVNKMRAQSSVVYEGNTLCLKHFQIATGHEPENDSNLVKHARRELDRIGEDSGTAEGILNVIRAFSAMGHSGGSAEHTIPILNELLQFKNLGPLTDDPEEWFYHGEEVWGSPGGVWQNLRNSEAFSNDGGKSFYLLSEGGRNRNRKPLHTSKKVT